MKHVGLFFCHILFIVVLGGMVVAPASALGNPVNPDPKKIQENITPHLEVPIGGFGSPSDFGTSNGKEVPWMSNYIRAIFTYGVSLAAVLAMLMIMIGGFLWLTAGGRSDQVSNAKDYISSALLGLALALMSYILLYTINPELVALKPLTIPDPHVVQPKPMTKAPHDPNDVRQTGEICCCRTLPTQFVCGWSTSAQCTSANGRSSSDAACQ